jgi:flagellar hook-length control protein FliK
MLKVLHAERAKNALSLPILSYDAAPDDSSVSDEFRELLQDARGSVGTENSNNLSDIVAATVMAGVMQPVVSQRSETVSAQRESGCPSADLSSWGEAERDANLLQSGGDLSLSNRQGGQPYADEKGLRNSNDQCSSDGKAAAAESRLGAGDGSQPLNTKGGESVNVDAPTEVREEALTVAPSVDTSSGFAQPLAGESNALGTSDVVQQTVVESAAKYQEKAVVSSARNEAQQQSPVVPDGLAATRESLGLAADATVAQNAVVAKPTGDRVPKGAADAGQVALNARDAEFLRFVGDSAGFAMRRTAEASAQTLLLRQSFEHRLSHGREGISAPSGVSASNSNGFSSNSFGVGGRSGSSGDVRERGRAESHPMSRQTALRMLERVQVTLKEAARARDGKTLSIDLEPVDLGRIKVDVSLKEGALHARLKPENSEVLQKLREHAHELQAALRKLGLDVERVTVTVSGEESREGDLPADSNLTGDGKGFQEQRNNMPYDEGQLVDNTFGNELAQGLEAVPNEAKTATTVWRDNWVA